ncbi:hypothetical protein PUNSTDRAFT_130298 [Punctularia strigosozonata HHB-11173 SS5]|uniref:uncharacterized protein n=1 Tax=Punctularia strigosozonata (strain HHB-11173) TaxID=741275 RepID=UPI00044175CC|nr:uncharacterized protein PUNSTDRAFT_130298 [Punctularia strigosozonata HHB-11173 SS5]EIN14673.1 hypothetical protein PUNSTDRAFT_130298 [Punctularia strigosozonata HHB-11173 SS5]
MRDDVEDDMLDPEYLLLESSTSTLLAEDASADNSMRMAPIFTGDALAVAGERVFPQRALYGRIVAQEADGLPKTVISPKLYINSNAPFSAVGSGISHTTSVLLESCLIQDPRLGTLPAPLSGIVFHFDYGAKGGSKQPCEAAYLASLSRTRGGNATPPKVTVLVLPTAIRTMRAVYAGLAAVDVQPLHFAPEDISGERLLAMMRVDTEQRMPHYMECIMSILHGMDPFDYDKFRDQLAAQKFDRTQETMLDFRLSLLDSCLQGGNAENRVSAQFKAGQLTIIDLSSPFMDASSACGFFDTILGLFIEADIAAAGKLIVLNKAHKYLTENGSSARLTDSLLLVVREQRHHATRVVISTQEPTVVPSMFLDLCSFVIVHRFSSPVWMKHLVNHLPAANKLSDERFSKVVSLRTGEAMIFAPSGLGATGRGESRMATVRTGINMGTLQPLGQGYLLANLLWCVLRIVTLQMSLVVGPQSRLVTSTGQLYQTLSGAPSTSQPAPSSINPLAAAAEQSQEGPVSFDGNPQLRFQDLLRFLVDNRAKGAARVSLSAVVVFLDGLKVCPYVGQRLTAYLEEAVALKYVHRLDGEDGIWLRPTDFAPIISVLDFHRHNGYAKTKAEQVLYAVRKYFPSVLRNQTWKAYVAEAADAGAVVVDQDWVMLPQGTLAIEHKQLPTVAPLPGRFVSAQSVPQRSDPPASELEHMPTAVTVPDKFVAVNPVYKKSEPPAISIKRDQAPSADPLPGRFVPAQSAPQPSHIPVNESLLGNTAETPNTTASVTPIRGTETTAAPVRLCSSLSCYSENLVSKSGIPESFQFLVETLRKYTSEGQQGVSLSHLGILFITSGKNPHIGRTLDSYLGEAESLGLIVRETSDSRSWVRLKPHIHDHRHSKGANQELPDSNGAASRSEPHPSAVFQPGDAKGDYEEYKEFGPLIVILKQMKSKGNLRPYNSTVAEEMHKQFPAFMAKQKRAFRECCVKAEAAHLIRREGDCIMLIAP